MNTKEIALINYINREGLNSEEWGIYTDAGNCTYRDIFGVESPEKCPDNFIYVWLPEDEIHKMVERLDWAVDLLRCRIVPVQNEYTQIFIWPFNLN